MLKRLLITTVAAGALTIAGAGAVFATPSPSGPGQPKQDCAGLPMPNGFGTVGFANAEAHYAGALANPATNPHAVSQYDVACFQLSTH